MRAMIGHWDGRQGNGRQDNMLESIDKAGNIAGDQAVDQVQIGDRLNLDT